jgi:hypothetical protein
MKQLTLNIEDKKYSFFLELIKSMDFISIENDSDWFENLSLESKKNIQKGIDDLENGRIHSHEDVLKMAKARIASLKNA